VSRLLDFQQEIPKHPYSSLIIQLSPIFWDNILTSPNMQWLVTGCSTGLGLDIARAALKAGQKCIATSRNPAKSPEAVEEINSLGGTWAALDVSSQSLESDIQKILNDHGKVDVVVNNAGYGDGGVLESMEYVQSLIATPETDLLL
jgi:NAD(P)-dependent dehydrogenase (short-subunit alcohol dehydrogenase family)